MTGQHFHPPARDLACAEAVEIMTEYLEGALPAAEARRLERHLETCPGCAEYLEQMQAIAGSLGDLTEDSIRDDLRADLIAAFRRVRGPDASP
jgi:anti-sigma factor RsiW